MAVLSLVLSVVLSVGCASGEDLVEPEMGQVALTVTTTGSTPDSDGYTLTVDDEVLRTIHVSATLTLDLVPGSHRLGLTGLASNCVVLGKNPFTMSVLAGNMVAAAFAVNCASDS